MPIHTPFWVVFEDVTPNWNITSKKLLKVKSTGHKSFRGILIILISLVVPEKLPEQKRCDKEDEEEHEFLGIFSIFLP